VLIFTKINSKTKGIITKKYHNAEFYYSCPERTLADYAYLHLHSKITKRQVEKVKLNIKIDRKKFFNIVKTCYPKDSSKIFKVVGLDHD